MYFNHLVSELILLEDEFSDKIQQFLLTDSHIGPYLKYLQDEILSKDENTTEHLQNLTLHKDSLVLHNGLMYVSDDLSLKLKILQFCHDAILAGHSGQAKILELVFRNYY